MRDYDSIKYIKDPYESVQEAAVNISYDALRYINSPCYKAEVAAIKNNEAAVKFITDLNKDKILSFLKVNILVIRYITRSMLNEISHEELEEIFKEVLSKDDVDEKYVRDFLNCSIIDRNSEIIDIDKIMFIYKYGSKKAKRIAVDEKLKMI